MVEMNGVVGRWEESGVAAKMIFPNKVQMNGRYLETTSAN